MKTNIFTAAVILTGCLCAWGYLSAQSDGTLATSPATPAVKSALLEIREPTQEDFEHCAKRAVDFLESISDNQVQTDLAMQILFLSGEAPILESAAPFASMSEAIVSMKNDTTLGRPELIAKKSLGENIIIFYYNYISDKKQVVCRFYFGRILDQHGELRQWQCVNFSMTEDIEQIVLLSP